MRRLPVAILTALAFVFPASAAAAWTTPADLVGPGVEVTSPQVEAAGDGSAALTYARGGRIWAAVKRPGELFGPPQDLGLDAGTPPVLAMSPTGRAIVAWNGGGTLGTAFREPGAGAFTVAAPVALNATKLAAAAAGNGRLYLGAATSSAVRLFSAAPGATSIGGSVALYPASGPTSLAIATQTGGDIAWLLYTDETSTTASAELGRWSSTIGASATRTLQSNTDGSPSTSSHYTFGAAAMSGDHPSFFWDRETYTQNGSFGSVTSDLFRVDEPVGMPVAPTTVDTGSAFSSFNSFYRSPLATAPLEGSAAATAWFDTTSSVGPGASQLFLSSRPSGGLPQPKLALPALTTPFAAPNVTSLDLAAAGSDTTQATYVVAGSKLATARLTAGGQLTSAEPVVVPTVSSAPPVAVAAGGTGAGDTVAFWSTDGASPQARLGQVAYDDVTPPTLSTEELFAQPAIQAVVPDQAGLDAFNAVARTLTFDATASDLWTPTTIQWDFGDGTTATGEHVTHTFSVSGPLTVTVTARDLAGNTTTKVLHPSIPIPIVRAVTPPTTPTTPGPATVKAVVGIAKLSATRFAVAKGKASSKKGSTLTYSLNAAAKVEISVLGSAKGYRSGKDCVAKRPKGKAAKRCTFARLLGLAGTPSGVAGANTFRFDGKVAGRFLKPGRYTLVIAAIASGESHGTNPVTLPFTIRK